MAKVEYLKEELELHELRLKELKKQKALQGISADASLDIEIGQIEAKVEALEQQIAQLGSGLTPPPVIAAPEATVQPQASGPYDIAKIRRLLKELFNEDDLRDFVLDDSDFKPVHDLLREMDRQPEILRRLVDHARRRNLMPKVLAWAKQTNPARYAQDEPYQR